MSEVKISRSKVKKNRSKVMVNGSEVMTHQLEVTIKQSLQSKDVSSPSNEIIGVLGHDSAL